MQFVDNLRQKPFVQKAEKFFPAIAFLGGFFWDSVTLGQMVENSDLIFLLAYYSGALILVILLSAHMEHPEGWTKDRIMAARAAAPRPQAKAPAPAVQAKAAPQVKPAPAPAPASTSKARAAQSAIAARLNPFAKKVTKKVTDAASEKLKTASSQAKNVAQKIANDVGYESTAIPENAIVVEHRFLDREWSETWKNRFSWAVQFCFGSLFSALVVCYFKSSGSIASLILVILLAVLLVGNEFLQKKYESFGVSLAFLCLLGTMFLNFTIPYLVHRIGLVLFVCSTLLSLGICVFIQKVSRRSKKGNGYAHWQG